MMIILHSLMNFTGMRLCDPSLKWNLSSIQLTL